MVLDRRGHSQRLGGHGDALCVLCPDRREPVCRRTTAGRDPAPCASAHGRGSHGVRRLDGCLRHRQPVGLSIGGRHEAAVESDDADDRARCACRIWCGHRLARSGDPPVARRSAALCAGCWQWLPGDQPLHLDPGSNAVGHAGANDEPRDLREPRAGVDLAGDGWSNRPLGHRPSVRALRVSRLGHHGVERHQGRSSRLCRQSDRNGVRKRNGEALMRNSNEQHTLAVEHLTKRYGDHTVVDDLALRRRAWQSQRFPRTKRFR